MRGGGVDRGATLTYPDMNQAMRLTAHTDASRSLLKARALPVGAGHAAVRAWCSHVHHHIAPWYRPGGAPRSASDCGSSLLT